MDNLRKLLTILHSYEWSEMTLLQQTKLIYGARAELAAKDEALRLAREALTEAVGVIRTWHNIENRSAADFGTNRFLSKEQIEQMWQLYQQSPEMKRITAALAKATP